LLFTSHLAKSRRKSLRDCPRVKSIFWGAFLGAWHLILGGDVASKTGWTAECLAPTPGVRSAWHLQPSQKFASDLAKSLRDCPRVKSIFWGAFLGAWHLILGGDVASKMGWTAECLAPTPSVRSAWHLQPSQKFASHLAKSLRDCPRLFSRHLPFKLQ
jgi:hypothetical protein